MPANIARLYEGAFPVEERRIWNPRPEGLQLLEAREESGGFIGFITLWNLKGITYVEHFALLPECRGRGYGSKILNKIDGPVVLEVEPPQDMLTRKRIAFYERNGFTLHPDFEYMQPPYGHGLPWVRLYLMTRGSVNLTEIKNLMHKEIYGQEI